jgi:N-acetylmuramoyl-L-alanine amidase
LRHCLQIQGIRQALIAVVLLACAALFGADAYAQGRPDISSVRLGERSKDVMRLVIDVNQPIEPAISVLPDPYRVVVDMPAANWPDSVGEGRGFISGYRYGLFSPTQSRLVLDLRRPAVVERAFMLRPSGQFGHRYVIDLKITDRKNFIAAAKSKKPVENLSPPVQATVAKREGQKRKPVVVVDAGHGGHDPGTQSRIGHSEKTIALNAAKEIARQLKATGRYTVVLTRDKDIFLPLKRRVEIARKNEADLFISVHADSIKSKSLAGGTVYTLSERASDAEAAALAAKENKADIIAGVDLNGENRDVLDILLSLAQRETMNFSAVYANYVVEEFGPKKLIPRRPHRFAGFVVLKAADVPSVLIEMGYLSNNDDAKRIASKRGREDIARSIVRATNRYFEGRLAQQF